MEKGEAPEADDRSYIKAAVSALQVKKQLIMFYNNILHNYFQL